MNPSAGEDRVLTIVKTGSTLPAISARRGDFERWFLEGTGVAERDARVVDVAAGEKLPEPDAAGAVIVTGSAAMVTEQLPWSVATGRWLARAVEHGTPVLAVCYGHQMLADALGGRVEKNPRGREIGTVEVTLEPAAADDPLFAGFPSRLTMQASHVESVTALPPGAVHLGQSAGDPHQAFRVGDRAWAVQFHPEFDADIARGYIEGRRDPIRAEGLDPDALLARVRESDDGRRLLRRFIELL
jgi:GMP synthase (glutamine-hydrolysing)